MCILHWASTTVRDCFICQKDLIIVPPPTLHMFIRIKNYLVLYFYTLYSWTSYWSCNEKNKHWWMRGTSTWGHTEIQRITTTHLFSKENYMNIYMSIFVDNIIHTDLKLFESTIITVFVYQLCMIKSDTSISIIITYIFYPRLNFDTHITLQHKVICDDLELRSNFLSSLLVPYCSMR